MVIEKKYDKRLSQNNRLIRMLHTLQRKEVKAFHQFLQSPYHNSNQAVLRFFEQLKDHHPEFRPDKLDKAALYQEVFGRKYDENQMNQLLTKTCRALEAFFAFEELRNDELLVTKLKRNAFSKRQLPNQYSKVSKQIQSRLGEEPVDESQHYLERFLLNKNLLYNAELEQKQKESYIRNCLENLDQWFIWEKLRLSCLALNETRVQSVEFDLFLLDEILNHSKNLIKEGRIQNFYRQIIHIQLEQEEIALTDVINWFEEASEMLPGREKHDFLVLFLNILFRRIREGEKSLIRLILEVYKIGLRKKILIVNEKLSHQTFINIAVAAIGCNEFKWAENFIETYRGIIKEYPEDSIYLAYGYLYFNREMHSEKRKVFNAAMDSLAKVVSSKSFFQYRARSLQLRIFYELSRQDDEWVEQVMYFAKAFRKHIRRKSQLNQRKAITFINFINLTEKLANYKLDQVKNRKRKLLKLKNEIEQTSPLFARDWIEEKFLELRK